MSIPEFPGLQIDDFRQHADRPTPVLCLLSHMHADHLLGLERQSYYGPLVYCSAATRAMVLNIRGNNGDGELKYHHLRKESCGIEILRSLEFDVAHVLPYGPRKSLQVTLISANHCPGAAMFLVQSQTQAILFTGDTRCEQWHVNALAHHPALLPFTFGERALSLYVDNSFEQHVKRELSYDGNFAGISHIMKMICDRPYRPDTVFAALFTTTGYEEVLVALAYKRKTKIHMDPYYYSLYLAAADFCPLAKQLVELCDADTSKCRLHWCRKGHCSDRDAQATVFFSPCVTIVPEAVTERNASLRLADFDIRGQCDQPVFCHFETGARYVLGSDMDTLLPGHMLFRFSRHASLPELQRLAALFPRVSIKSATGNAVHGFQEPEPVSVKSTPPILNDTPRKEPVKPIAPGGALPLYKKQMAKPRQPVRRKRELKRRSFTSSSSDDHHEVLALLNQHASKAQSRAEKPDTASTGPGSLTPPVTPKKPRLSKPQTTKQDRDDTGGQEDTPDQTEIEAMPKLAALEPTIADPVSQEADSLASPPASPSPSPRSSQPTPPATSQPAPETARPAPRLVRQLSPPLQDIKKRDAKALPAANTASELERQLRNDLSSWFELKFDWASHEC